MQLQDNLTKENFWDRMMATYPNATAAFCQWVDEYKEATEWKKLFNDSGHIYLKDSLGNSTNSFIAAAPKFHDLPHAMQLGIWIECVCQRGGCSWPIENMFEFDLAEDIEGMFRELLEEEAKNEKELSEL
jgi:hypothetical protein